MAPSLLAADRGCRTRTILTPALLMRAAIVALAVALYLPSLGQMAIWDDHMILSGSAIGGGKSLLACFTRPFLGGYFRPLVSVSFYLDRRMWGTGPWFYHQTNVLLHAVTALLLFEVLDIAFRSRRVAFLGGLLFAVEPVQVSTVAWIGGRTDSLCALWMTLFAWALVRGARAQGRGRGVHVGAALAAYALAVFTKEQALPALLLVPLAFTCWSEGRGPLQRRAIFRTTAPFLLVPIAFFGLFAFFGPGVPGMAGDTPQYALVTFLRSVCYFALVLFAPTTRWIHTMSMAVFLPLGALPLLAGAALLAATGGLFFYWLRRAPSAAWFLAYIVLTLAVVSNFVPVPSMLIAPYRAGIAGVGAAALVAWLLDRLFATGGSVPEGISASSRRLVPWAVSLGVLLWWGALTGRDVLEWQNDLHISQVFARSDPGSLWIQGNLVAARLNTLRRQDACQQMEELLSRIFGSDAWMRPDTAERALSDDPRIVARVREIQGTVVEPRRWLADFYAQLGAARSLMGQDAAGRAAFLTGYHIEPRSYTSCGGLGVWAYHHGRYREATGYLRLAIAEGAETGATYGILARVLEARGRLRQARNAFTKATELQPWVCTAYLGLADLDVKLGDYVGARQALQNALRKSICDRAEIRSRIADIEAARHANRDGGSAVGGQS